MKIMESMKGKIKKVTEKYRFDDLRIIYAIPLLITVILWVVWGFDVRFIAAYLASILVIAGLFLTKRIIKKTLLLGYAGILLVTLLGTAFFAKKTTDYKGEFETAFATMREHYVLTKEKAIDWDALYGKYKPLFAEVNRSQDMVQNYKTWLKFTNEFYDGHTSFQMENQAEQRRVMMESFGNDYGLSIMQLSTGEYVAVNVEGYENSYSALLSWEDDLALYKEKEEYLPEEYEDIRLTLKENGIQNGTVILKWNGKNIEEYFAEMDYYFQAYPVRENEDFYRPLYVAGIGENMQYGETTTPGKEMEVRSEKDKAESSDGDKAETSNGNKTEILNGNKIESSNAGATGEFALITYLDENGQEKEIKAPRLGAYMPRLYSSIKKLDAGENISNLTWKSIDDKTMLLRISAMAYDQQSYGYPEMYQDMVDRLRSEVIAIMESGRDQLIIDLRANTGGDPFFVQYIAGLFAPQGEHENLYSAVINEKTAIFERDENGKYVPGGVLTYAGEDLWHDGKIILLVNAECVSAGDDMTYLMGEYPNVKVMGITRTNSSCQAVTGISVGGGYLSFSAVPNIDRDGNVVIDTLTDREGRTPFDERIPFDQEAVKVIFDKGEDFQIPYVLHAFD